MMGYVTNELPASDVPTFDALRIAWHEHDWIKGLILADKILAKHPHHGETLAIKGFFLYMTGKYEEGMSLARMGAKYDCKNSVCWQICGDIYKLREDIERAYESYSFSLLFNPGSIEIATDISSILIYKGDYKKYNELQRNTILGKSPGRWSYLEFAFSSYLVQDYKIAEVAIEGVIKALKSDEELYQDSVVHPSSKPLGHVIIFKCLILEKSKKYQELLNEISNNEKFIYDNIFKGEILARVYLNMNDKVSARNEYMKLFSRRTESEEYLKGIIECSINTEDEASVISLFEELKQKFPKSQIIWMLPLNYLRFKGKFKEFAKEFFTMYISRKCPSLFSVLRYFYREELKAQILHDICVEHLEHLQKDEKALTTVYEETVWTMAYLAQSFLEFENFKSAMDTVNKALEYSPNTVELYSIKASIFEACGDLNSASEMLERVKNLDSRDKSANFEYMKSLMRIGKDDLAEGVLKSFMGYQKEDIHIEFSNSQIVEFFFELAKCYLLQGKYEQALCKFYALKCQYERYHRFIIDIFSAMPIQPVTLLSQLNFANMFNNPYNDKIFVVSATNVAKLYLLSHTKKYTLNFLEHPEPETNPRIHKPKICHIKQPLCTTLKHLPSLENGLGVASELISTLMSRNLADNDAYKVGYEVFVEMGNFEDALKCLKSLKNPDAHFLSVKLAQDFAGFKSKFIIPNETEEKIIQHLAESLKLEPGSIFSRERLIEANKKYAETEPTFDKYFAAIRCADLLGDAEEVLKLSRKLSEIPLRKISHEKCADIFKTLKDLKIPSDTVKNFASSCCNHFVWSSVFSDSQDKIIP